MYFEVENFIFATITYLVELGIIWGILFFLMECRFKRKILSYIIVVVVADAVSMVMKYSWPTNYTIRTLVYYIFFAVLIIVIFEDPMRRRIDMVIGTLTIVSIAESSSILLLKMIYPIDINELSTFSYVFRIGVVIVDGMLFLMLVYFAVFWRIFVDKKSASGEILFLFIPTYQLVLLIMYYRACQEYTMMHSYFGIGVTVMGVIMDCLFMYFIRGMEKKIEVEEQLSRLYSQRQYELDYYKMTNQHIEEMREVRHDFKNQIQTAYIMVDQGADKEKVRKLLGETNDWMERTHVARYCENSVVNALLTVKKAKAFEQGINMNIQCQMREHLEEIEEIDLCSLVGNLLDNAIEACAKVQQRDKRTINIKAGERGGYQILRIENTYEDNPVLEQGRIKTTKENEQNHGYGLKMVERICKKYNGKLECDFKDKVFTATTWIEISNKA